MTSDAEVIKRSRRDPARFAQLFDRHAPHIHRYLARRLGSQIADDLLAETFLVAFSKRRAYDVSHPDARPWLYGIATRLVAQHRRDEMRRYCVRTMMPVDGLHPDHAERVIADVVAQSTRRVLSQAMAALPDGDRDVLVLIAREELTYEEVARALEIPVGTVRSRMHRVRTSLRRTLQGHDHAAIYEEILSNE